MEMKFAFFEYCMIVSLILYGMSALLVCFRAPRPGSWLVMTGLGVNVIALVSIGYIGGEWYFFPMLDELRLIPAIIAIFAFAVMGRGERRETMAIMGMLLLVTFIAVISQTDPPMPTIKSKSLFASLFFLSEAVSVALFLMAGALAVSTLLVHSSIRKPWNGPVLWGFLIFTLCQILGSLWAFIGWSYPFSWSPRHLVSASIWCFYGAAIHFCYIRMNTKLKALLIMIGIIPVVFMVYHHQIMELLGTKI